MKRLVTRGARRIGRAIRKLSNSVELSGKENRARDLEIIHNKEAHEARGYTPDSPVQDLRDLNVPRQNKQENQD